MQVQLNSPQLEAIDRFVEAHPDATANHRTAWLTILARGLGHRPMSLSAWRDGQCIGWLPLVETRSLFFGRHLVSLPYVNEAGLLADESRTRTQLIEHAEALGHKRSCRFVELRNRQPIDQPGCRAVRTDKKRMLAELPGSTDDMWSRINCKVRNQVRKAQKHDLDIMFGGDELLEGFYHVFARNMRDLGTPTFPRRLFAAMLEHLGDDAELCLVSQSNQPIGGAILVYHRDLAEVPSASTLRAYNHTCANMLMYWQLISRAIERGAAWFDFGRSSEGCGTYRFKKQWTAQPHDTGWQQIALVDDARPITKEDDRFGMAVALWKRMPVWLTRVAGPPIVRGIP
jgi:FemAB-related protein (PEP-CTERM system-associated)